MLLIYSCPRNSYSLLNASLSLTKNSFHLLRRLEYQDFSRSDCRGSAHGGRRRARDSLRILNVHSWSRGPASTLCAPWFRKVDYPTNFQKQIHDGPQRLQSRSLAKRKGRRVSRPFCSACCAFAGFAPAYSMISNMEYYLTYAPLGLQRYYYSSYSTFLQLHLTRIHSFTRIQIVQTLN